MMKAYLTLGAGLIINAFGACPFELLKRSGALSEADLTKFEAVKQDPKAAETLFEAHKRDAAPNPAPAGVIGPIVNGALDLPYGGGLRMCFPTRAVKTTLLTCFYSQWSSPGAHRTTSSRQYTCAPSHHTGKNPRRRPFAPISSPGQD